MIRKLPYADWLAACLELDRIQLQLEDLSHLPQIDPMLAQARNSLIVEASPSVAGAELELIAEQLKDYPPIAQAASRLSKMIIDFPFAEVAPEESRSGSGGT